MKCKKWILAKGFCGEPTRENIQLVDYQLSDELNDGEILLKAVYLSVEPYVRLFPSSQEEDMNGEQLSEVVQSKSEKYPVGTLVLSNAGWKSHYLCKDDACLRPIEFDASKTPKSYILGPLGIPGATAFLAFEKCLPKPNEVVLVTAAAGAVGNIVGQLAKIKGCKVIGLVGTNEKLEWCTNELKFDHVINHNEMPDFSSEIAKIAPAGIDIFFDNVGGDFFHTIVNYHMKISGRVLICGSIQTYNETDAKLFPGTNVSILMNELLVLGFVIYNHKDQVPRALTELNKLIDQGHLKIRETIYEGIENMFDAFVGVVDHEPIGKTIVRA